MKKKLRIAWLLLFAATTIRAGAVGIPPQEKEIVSPEIDSENRVTFRLFAPKAGEVLLIGDFLPPDIRAQGGQQMLNDGNGLWSFTSEPLPSEFYSYAFVVDGLRLTDPNNVYSRRDVADVMSIFLIGGGQGSLYQINAVPHGTVAKRWYHSPGNGNNRRMTVYTPPGYESGRQEYPVLYLLHGMGNDEEGWTVLGRAAQILDNLIAQGKAKPMIVVMPNGNVALEAAPGESSLGFYKPAMRLPHTMDGKFEETFPEIRRFVEDNYRVIAHQSGRAIAGLSMGGYHALHIARYYPGTFDYIGLFSAAIFPDPAMLSEVYRDIDNTLLRQKNEGYKLYRIAIGRDDFLYPANVEYRDKLDLLELEYSYTESDGGHTWRNWRSYLAEFLPLLFR